MVLAQGRGNSSFWKKYQIVCDLKLLGLKVRDISEEYWVLRKPMRV